MSRPVIGICASVERARWTYWDEEAAVLSMNYAPIVFLLVLTAVTVWWHASAKNWFKGPKRTVDQEIEAEAVEEGMEPPSDSHGGPAPAAT